MGLKEDIERIRTQEEVLTFAAFDENTAFQLGARLHTLATESTWSLTIDIRRFERPLFFAATPGATAENVDWIRRKFNVLKHFGKSSYRVGLETREKGTTLEARSGLPLADYAPNGGAFPIRVAGAGVIGAVIVSGLPQRQDHETVVAVLCETLGLDYADLALGPED